MNAALKRGDRVTIPWGLDASVSGTVVEVWGDPPRHVRVQIDPPAGDAEDPMVLLLAPSAVRAA